LLDIIHKKYIYKRVIMTKQIDTPIKDMIKFPGTSRGETVWLTTVIKLIPGLLIEKWGLDRWNTSLWGWVARRPTLHLPSSTRVIHQTEGDQLPDQVGIWQIYPSPHYFIQQREKLSTNLRESKE